MAKDRGFDIGFHTGIGGNANGISDFMRDLSANDIQFFLKSVDDYGIINEALNNYLLGDGQNHTLVFRLSAKRDGNNFDVPDYSLTPAQAAEKHWALTRTYLPPEFLYSAAARTHVWLEVVNEVDKNRSEWLAEFAIEISNLALAQGFKLAMFGWSAGEPEPEHWRGPNMQAFLRMIAANPDRLAIALHEYSLDNNDLFAQAPWLVGRYKELLNACDENGIPHPKILITEFGWGAFDLPDPSVAAPQLVQAAQKYYQDEAVLGAAIWFLGGGWSDIANKAQKLIYPMRDTALAFTYYRDASPSNPPPPQGDCEFDDRFTKYHILRPRSLTAAQWEYVMDLTDNGIARSKLGLPAGDPDPVPIGYEGWSHVDAIIAIKRALEAGYTDSRLVIVDGHLIGTGLDSEWLSANCPFVAPYAIFLRSDGQQPPNPGDPVIYNIVEDLPKSSTSEYATRPRSDITQLVIHHTTGDPYQSIYNIASYHVNGKGWPGIGYHFVIDGDGKINMTNYPETLSYHSNYANPYAMAICMQGNFMYAWPSDAQLAACKSLIDYLKREIPTITQPLIPHRDAPGANTQCPGDTYTEWWHILTGKTPPPDPPPVTGIELGLHASADPALAAGEVAMMQQARVQAIKVLSNIRKEDVSALSNTFPKTAFIVRAFLDFGGRNVTPNNFLDWTFPDINEIVNRLGTDRPIWIELHNEPNLVAEGLGSSWADGNEFNAWLSNLVSLYKSSSLPSTVKFLYPGLSPGASVAGIRQDSVIFAQQSMGAALMCDGIGVHNYWSAEWPMSLAISQLKTYLGLFGSSQLFWITEASNNRPASEATKAAEYIEYARQLSAIAGVIGVTYFVASASNPAWGWGTGGSGEVWLGTSIPQLVGSR